MKTIYVGNLPLAATEDQLGTLFKQYGDVLSIRLISDRDTGRPRGFGFVDMEQSAAEVAIRSLDGCKLGERNLRVNAAQSRKGHPARRARS